MQSRFDALRQSIAGANRYLTNVGWLGSRRRSPGKQLPEAAPAQPESPTFLAERQINPVTQPALSARRTNVPPPISLPLLSEPDGAQSPVCNSPLVSPGSDSSGSEYFDVRTGSQGSSDAGSAAESGDASSSDESVYFDSEEGIQKPTREPLNELGDRQSPACDSGPLVSPGSDSSGSEYFDTKTGPRSGSDVDSAAESDDSPSSDSVYSDSEEGVQQPAQEPLSQSVEQEEPAAPIEPDHELPTNTPEPLTRRKPGMVDSGVKWVKNSFKNLWSNISTPQAATAGQAKAHPPAIEQPPSLAKPSTAENRAKSTGTGLKGYLLRQGLSLAKDPLIQRTLANAISKVVIAELKLATKPASPTDTLLDATRRVLFQDILSFIKDNTDSVITQSLGYGASCVLSQTDANGYIEGFAKTISPPVRQLVGEFCLQQLDWADSEEGQRFLQEAMAHFIGERVESAARAFAGAESLDDELADTLPAFLSQKVSSGFQHSAALLQQRLAALASSEATRQFIDDMVMQLVADGSDKLQGSFTDLHTKAVEIIHETLHQGCSYLLNLFEGWGENESDVRCIKRLRDHIIGQIAHETASQYNRIGDKELLKLLPKESILKKILLWLLNQAVAEVRNPDALARMVNDFMARVEPQITRALQEQVRKIHLLTAYHQQHGQNFAALANRLALNEAIKNHGHEAPVIQATADVATGAHFTLPPMQPAEICAIGQGLVSALQLALHTAEGQREAIEAAITPCLEQLVHRAFASAREHGGRWLTDEQDVELMAATLPWCQRVTKELLHEGFIEGLQVTREWLDQDDAPVTLVRALAASPKASTEPVTDLASLIIPRIRSALDDRLDHAMAQMLRAGAHRFGSAMSGQQFLAMPVVRDALDDAISKAIQTITHKAGQQLEPLAREVLQPVQAILQQELMAIGPASIHFMVTWLKDDRHTHELVAALLPGFEPLIARVLSEIVAAQLSGSENPASLQQLTAPWLGGLVQQLLTPAVQYSLKRVVDWADCHQQAFENLIQPHLAQTLEAAQPLMLDAIRERLAQLEAGMAGHAGVAEKALRLADRLAPDEGNTPSLPETSEAITLADEELQAISTDLAAAVRLGLNEVHRHQDAIRTQINTHLDNVVAVAVRSTANHVARQVAEDDVGTMQAEQFASATTPWCQTLATTLLSEALTEGLRSIGELNTQPLIHNALTSAIAGEQATDSPVRTIPTLDSMAVPHIQSAINVALDQTMATILHRGARQLQGALESQQLFTIPAIRDAVDSTLRTAICDGAGKTEQQLELVQQEVLRPITRNIASELLTVQRDAIGQVLAWLDNEENARTLIATLTPGVRTVIERVLMQTLADNMAGATPLTAVLQPALLRLVDTMLEPTVRDILTWVVHWARSQQPIIVKQIQQEIEQTLNVCQPMLIVAIRQRADQLLRAMSIEGPDSTAARAVSLAQQLAPAQADRPDGDSSWQLRPNEVDSLGNALAQSVQLVLQTLHDQQETILDTVNPHLERVVEKAVTTASAHLARQIAGDEAAAMQPGCFSQAAAPWCQHLAADLLSRALTEGLSAAMTWANDDARQTITKALTSTDEQTTTDAALMPYIQQALDHRLDQTMADLLRCGASQWHTSMANNEFLARPFVRTVIDQQVRKVIGSAAAEAREQLLPLSQAVLNPVREQLRQELLALQTTTIDHVLAWLKNPEQTRELMATVLPSVAEIIKRVLSDTLATQLDEQARPLTEPMLNGLVRHLLTPAMNYTLQRLTDWAERNRQTIVDQITPQIEQTLDNTQPLLLAAIEKRLHQLQMVTREGDVAARAVALADQLDPNGSLPASADEPSQPRQLEPLLPQISQTITALISQSAQRIASEPAIASALVPHVARVVNAALNSGTVHINERLAEPTDGDITHINQAVASHLQGVVAGYLSQGVASGIEQAVTAITSNPDKLNQLVEGTLRQLLLGEVTTIDLDAVLTPLVAGAVDQMLDRQALLAGINAWIAENATTVTPQLHRAMDQVLSHIMANIGEFLLRHSIAGEVLPDIQNELNQTLINVQAELISGVTGWLSSDANQSALVAALAEQLQPAIATTVTRALAQQLSEHQPCTAATIAPTVAPIVNKALNHALAGAVAWVADELPKYRQQITALTEPLIRETVDEAMPAVERAVQNKALLLAQNKAQDIDFNRLAAELSVAFAEQLDLDSATGGAVQVGPNTNVAKELPRLLCLLLQSAETYRCLGGNLNEPVLIDHLAIGGVEFNNVQAQLVQQPDGSVHIHHMSLTFRDAKGVDMDIELAGIAMRAQWPESSKLYKAALLSGASMMNPADAAASLFNAFTPDSIEIKIDQITGEFKDALLNGPHEDTIGFGLSQLEFDVRLHKYYPNLYADIRVCPKESIIGSLRSQGLVEHIDANVQIDANRQGHIDIQGQADPGRLNRLLKWLIGGKIQVNARVPVHDGIATLDDINGITAVTERRFSGLCKAIVKNTLRTNHPELIPGENGKDVIKLKLALFAENRSNRVTSWLARMANRVFRFFFPKPIEIQVGLQSLPYTPPTEGERGLGSFNLSRFIDGLSPWPLSLQSETHKQLLRDLRTTTDDRTARLRQLDKVIDHVISEFRLGNTPSDLSLVREIPLADLQLLVENTSLNRHARPRLLFLIACLTDALPEKAVQLVNACGPASRPYLLDLVAGTPRTEWLTNPDGTVMEPRYQWLQFQRLRQFWYNSQNNPDGNIYSPDQAKGPVQQCAEKMVALVNQLGDKLNLPDELKLVLARDFDFASKLFKPGNTRNEPRHTTKLPEVKPLTDRQQLRVALPPVGRLNRGIEAA